MLTETKPAQADLLRLYEQMVLLRQCELTAQAAYKKGEMPGFIHLYIGEEATAVGVCAHLRPSDWITSTHRGHGHALAKGVPPRALLAELFGKATGCCGGRGGSMHLYDPGCGLFGTKGAAVRPRGDLRRERIQKLGDGRCRQMSQIWP